MLFETAINHLNENPKFIRKIITETPDKVKITNLDDSYYDKTWDDADAVTFAIISNMYFQVKNLNEENDNDENVIIHGEIYNIMRLLINKIGNNLKEFIQQLEMHRIEHYNVSQKNFDKLLIWYSEHSTRSANIRHEFDIAGRLWTSDYIIAFWKRAKDMKSSDVNLMMEAIVTFFIEKSLRLSNISFLGHQGLYAPDLKLANKNLLY